MSDTYLALALASTFLAVGLLTASVVGGRNQHRRAAQVLEAQLGSVDLGIDLKQEELNRPLTQRFVHPAINGFGAIVKRLTSEDMRNRLDRKLLLAGSPKGWNAERIMAIRLLVGVILPTFFLTTSVLGGKLDTLAIVGAGLLCYVGWFGPHSLLSGRANRRQENIRRELPDTMDLLTISVEAGLGFDAAVGQCITNIKGTLSDELARVMQEMQLGVARAQAFRNLDTRTDVEELKSFVLAMIQADQFGISVSRVLRAQAGQLRVRRRQRAEEKAMKLPVKMIFPLILCVMPALFVVIIGPGVVRMAQNLFTAF
ncbi:MAG: type II secretion system F family protein [Betaproteobacteria bacterium]|nr:type II secretion system F family protein [Betaproteobacteria bacterium]